MKTIKNYVLLGVLLLPLIAVGQQTFVASKQGSEVKITGTSSLHDWEEIANEFTIQGKKADNVITDLEVKIQAKSIESGKSIMDEKTHEALKANKYPVIIFRADELKIIGGEQIKGTGQLHIAGREKTVPVTTTIAVQKAGSLTVKGSMDIIMSEFGIAPPTAMFGTMITGDKVTINYEFQLNYQ